MTHITDSYCFYSLERDEDVSGKSGTGTVAYLLELEGDGVVMLWDTDFDLGEGGVLKPTPSCGIEWLPHLKMVEVIHGYEGKTRIVPIEDPADQARVEQLLKPAVDTLMRLSCRFIRTVPA